MQNRSYRSYRGPLQAVILDWAGTVVDYGSRAPVAAIIAVFRQRGVELTSEQARGPMGRQKREHILAVASLPAVRGQWAASNGGPWTEREIDELYAAFLPKELAIVAELSDVIPGAVEAAAWCRWRGIRLGSCTGYSRAIMDVVVPRAAEQGYSVDSLVCPEEAGGGRPRPWMIFGNAMALDVYPLSACVKVGDTAVDIEEGLNAGTWTIAVARSGNELGLSEAEAATMDARELARRLELIRERLLGAGAHEVIDTVAELPSALEAIGERLAGGERP